MPPAKNYGIDIAREIAEQSDEDWIFGAASPTCLAVIPEGERNKYLPQGELQFGAEDFMDCALRGPVNIYEAKFTYLYVNKLLSPDNLAFLAQYWNPVTQRIEFSDRFNAILSNTTRQGNSMKSPVESIRNDGLIPKSMLPRGGDGMTFAEYHNEKDITDAMIALGKEFKERFTLNYDKVYEDKFKEALKNDFISVALYAWPEPVDGVYQRVLRPENHVCDLVKDEYDAFDNYIDSVDGDFFKKLAPDYNFFEYGYRPIVAAEHVYKKKEEEVKNKSWFAWIRSFFGL